MSEHTVVGTLEVIDAVWSPQLRNRRDILVYLPPSYAEGGRRYPVIYMHDGQNLFDEATSYCGEWQVDETMEELSREGIEAIVVGIPNQGERRIDEYGPFLDSRNRGGRGEQYLAFIVQTLKPRIDRRFRTLTGRAHTGIMGSSMGGLISLYGFFRYPQVFGLAGVMSPSLWFAGRTIFDTVQRAPFVPGKIYLDIGTGESDHMVADARRMRRLLRRKGYRPGHDLYYVEERGAGHCEADWAARLRHAIPFLLQRPESIEDAAAGPGALLPHDAPLLAG